MTWWSYHASIFQKHNQFFSLYCDVLSRWAFIRRILPSKLSLAVFFLIFFGRYVKQDNRCRFVRRPSLSPISWLNDRVDALELIFRLDLVFAIIYVVFPHNDMMTSIHMWKWWNHSTYSFSTPFFLILSCHCWRWFL